MSHPLDQFSPETGDKPKELVEVEINVSFDVWVKVPASYTGNDLNAAGDRFRAKYKIEEPVSFVAENF